MAEVAWGGRSALMWLRLRVAEWEAVMVLPFGVLTMIGFFVTFLSMHGVSAQMKWLVHPESAQPTRVWFLLVV